MTTSTPISPAAEAPALAFRDFGTGPRRALLIHGALAQAGVWRGVAERLGDLLTMRAVDLPGHGHSPDWDGSADYHDFATAALRRVIDGFAPIPNASIDLVGHSFGGTLALRLALEAPERVRSLVMLEPVLVKAALDAEPALADAYARHMAPFRAALARGDRLEAARLFTADFGTGTRWEDLPESARRDLARRIHLVLAGEPVIIDDRPGLLAPDRLERFSRPVLMIEGSRSLPVHRRIHRLLARRFQNARIATIDGAGHMLPATHPEAVASEIRSFLVQS